MRWREAALTSALRGLQGWFCFSFPPGVGGTGAQPFQEPRPQDAVTLQCHGDNGPLQQGSRCLRSGGGRAPWPCHDLVHRELHTLGDGGGVPSPSPQEPHSGCCQIGSHGNDATQFTVPACRCGAAKPRNLLSHSCLGQKRKKKRKGWSVA